MCRGTNQCGAYSCTKVHISRARLALGLDEQKGRSARLRPSTCYRCAASIVGTPLGPFAQTRGNCRSEDKTVAHACSFGEEMPKRERCMHRGREWPYNAPNTLREVQTVWHSSPPPPPCVTFRLVVAPLRGLDGHPFFPSHVASGRCFLSAAAAGALAGIVSAFAEPSSWCVGTVLNVAWCAVCASTAPNNWRIEDVLVVVGVV